MKKVLFLTLCVLSVTVATAQDRRGLKDAYKDYFLIGVAVNQRNISAEEQVDLVKREYSSITAENDMKPVSVHPDVGKGRPRG